MKIVDILESTRPIKSDIRNAYIDFSRMTTEPRGGGDRCGSRRASAVIGYGFNSNGRYGQGGLIRERFLPRRILEAGSAKASINENGDNLDPAQDLGDA
jgi:hypothetical protein